MPRLDGFGLLRELRGRRADPHIPVMMLSARAGEESRIEGFQAGADDYLVKPFTGARAARASRGAAAAGADPRGRRAEHAPDRVGVLRRRRCRLRSCAAPIMSSRWPTSRMWRWSTAPWSAGRCVEAFPELEDQGIVESARSRLRDRRAVRRAGGADDARTRPRRRRPNALSSTVVCQPLFDRAGAVEGIAAVVYDVTELASAREAAEAANRAKDEFLAMLGHELRNPLAPILTALQLLRLRGVEAGERERSDHRAAGAASRPPGRRSARRLADHARQGAAAAGADRAERDRGEGDRDSPARCSSSSATRSSSTCRGAA